LPLRLGVDEVEYRVTPSRTVVGAGNVQFNVHNFGEDQHDLAIARDGVIGVQTPLIDSQGTATVTADLSPGTYRLYCTLFGGQHDAWGMNATITVQ
jgi:plastocyanin